MKLRNNRQLESGRPRQRSLDVLHEPAKQEGFDPRVEVTPELRAAWFKGLLEGEWGQHYPAVKAAEFLLLFPGTPPEQRQILWNKFEEYLRGRFVWPVHVKIAQLIFPEHQTETAAIFKSGSGSTFPENNKGEDFYDLLNLILLLQAEQQNSENTERARSTLRKVIPVWREMWKNPPQGRTRDDSFLQLLAWLKVSDPALFSELRPNEDEIQYLKQNFNRLKGTMSGYDVTYSISDAFALRVLLTEGVSLEDGRLIMGIRLIPEHPLPDRPTV